MEKLVLILIFLPACLFGQHIPVLPGLTGHSLDEAIRSQFTPTTLGYTNARDTLFRNILLDNNQIHCLYSDYAITLNPNSDPSEDAFNKGINTEHIYPQSKGAELEPARSNMYNLYPVRENINNDRGNLPFGEVNDVTTKWWYYLDQKVAAKPANNFDLYSELGNNLFEPVESRKGDIARSIFYFVTIYKNESEQADPNFLQTMVEDLCQWHIDDPVDTDEWNRNIIISAYQDDKVNPFIYDCTIPERSICSGFNIECTPVSSTKDFSGNLPQFACFPNPVTAASINIELLPEGMTLLIFNHLGAKVSQIHVNEKNVFSLDISGLTSGVFYLYQVNKAGRIIGKSRFVKI